MRDAAKQAGRDPDIDHDLRGRARVCRRRRSPTCATSAAGSAGWSATTSPRSSAATAATAASSPGRSPSTSKGRKGYDYSEHGRAGNPDAEFVPDEIIDRFCILGPVETHLERLRELRELGVDQFAIYLQHDDKDGHARGVRRAHRSADGRRAW